MMMPGPALKNYDFVSEELAAGAGFDSAGLLSPDFVSEPDEDSLLDESVLLSPDFESPLESSDFELPPPPFPLA